MKTRFTFIALLLTGASMPMASGLELQRIKYNHPGLEVDLGVGLWAWPLPMDFDGDGDLDLVVNCPDKPSNGTYFFENATGDTAKNAMPVFKAGKRISKGMQNVQVSYVEGKPVVMSPAAVYPDFLKTGIDQPSKLELPMNVHVNKVRGNMWRTVDYDGDGKNDIVVGADDWTEYGWDNAYDKNGIWKNGPLRGYVYLLRNTGSNQKAEYAKPVKVMAGDRPVETFGWPSPNFVDFDGDGDLDLLCGEFLDGFTYFQNTGTRDKPKYALGKRVKASNGTYLTMDLEMITPTTIDWNKDGRVDLIVGDEDGRVAFVENTGEIRDGVPVFKEPVYFKQEAEDVKFGALATPVGFDWDGDGDVDIICGNTAGYIAFIENLSGAKVEAPKWAAPKLLTAGGKVIRPIAGANGSIQGPCEAKWGYTTQSVADWNGDGLPDVLVNSILGKVYWYENVGTRKEPKLAEGKPIEVEWKDGKQPELAYGWLRPEGDALLTQWRTTPVAVDWNKDGLTDLVMLDQEGYLAFFERFKDADGMLKLKHPERVLVADERVESDPPTKYFQAAAGEPLWMNKKIAGGSGRRKLCVVDWDQDGNLDWLMNAANASFVRQTKSADGKWYFKDMGLISPTNIEGHDVSPTVVDFNGDGVPDFLGGAEDGYLYYLRNPKSATLGSGIQAAPPASPAVVKSEFIYEPGPYPQIHATTMAETSSGLVAAWFGGTHEKNPDVGIWVSRWEDGKWTTSVEVANGVQYTKADGSVLRHPTWNPVLFQPKEGPLLLFYKAGPNPDAWWGMLTTSSDGGKTWSEPRRLPEGILGPIKNRPIQLENGDILCPTSDETRDEPSKWMVHFEVTSDLGKTWRRIGPVHDGIAIQAIQPSILKLGGEKLLAIGRSRQNKVFEVVSEDLGKTWGEMKLGTLPNNNSGTDAVTLKDGRHVMVYNHIGGEPGKWGGKRTPLNVGISDDAKTWKAALVLENEAGEYSYPTVLQTKDGLVHITYTWKRQKVKHVVVDPQRLEGKEIKDGQWPE